MDFFQHQEVARRKTGALVVYFCVAVALIVAAVYLAVRAIYLATQEGPPVAGDGSSLWDPATFALAASGTLVLIGLGSAYKVSQLRGGGRVVAESLGGRRVHANTRDLDERVLLNVVEEMAIASGVPVPPVYVLADEPGINAFAAGFAPGDAVIGVTRGALETLTREELQGVIAHEFSHLLNGDMRLNIRLVGVLHGILLIALTGYGILRTMRHVRGSRSKKGGGAIAAVFLLGVAFLVIGYVGVFFGRLIKSAVSRQREFLADASAVQFTRNPPGLGGALKKIGGAAQGSRLQDEEAEEVSHMFFGNALDESFLRLMSTHPPLAERIRRIEPRFDGKFPGVDRVSRTARDLARADRARERRKQQPTGPSQVARERVVAFHPAAAVASVGTLEPESIAHAADLVAALPGRLQEAVHEPFGAVATVYCLLLDANPERRRRQLRILSDHAGAYHEVGRLLPLVDALGPEIRLPLAEMAIPALSQMTWLQYRKFCEVVERLITADEKIDLFEQALERMLVRRLTAHFVKPRTRRVLAGSGAVSGLAPEVSCLLSRLAREGQREEVAAQEAFSRGAARLAPAVSGLQFLPRAQLGLERLDRAVGRLAAVEPRAKKLLLEAAAACIETDGKVTVAEGELLRMLADALECPMPPLAAPSAA